MKHKHSVLDSVMKKFGWSETEARSALHAAGEQIIEQQLDEWLDRFAARTGYPAALVKRAARIALVTNEPRVISAQTLRRRILREIQAHTSA